MKINHIALWVNNLELMAAFYIRYFDCKIGTKYENKLKKFESVFLHFPDGPSIELMKNPDISPRNLSESIGLAHFAISLGSTDLVDELTKRMESENVSILGFPRWTGDGFYESLIADPEGNRVELTV